MTKEISSFEYAFNNIINPELNKGLEPRTEAEENELLEKDLKEQLGKMRNATTGEPLI